MECYKHDHADGNLFDLLVLVLEVEREDGIPVHLGHCSQECDMFHSLSSLCRVASPTGLRVHSFPSLVMAVFSSKICWSLSMVVAMIFHSLSSLCRVASPTALRVHSFPSLVMAVFSSKICWSLSMVVAMI